MSLAPGEPTLAEWRERMDVDSLARFDSTGEALAFIGSRAGLTIRYCVHGSTSWVDVIARS